MAKLNGIVESTQKLQIGPIALTTCIGDLETWVNGQQPNRNNYRNEGRLGRDCNTSGGNNDYIEDTADEHRHHDIKRSS